MKIVRNASGKKLGFAFMGGYHGRTLASSAIKSSYRYRLRFCHFSDRAHFVFFLFQAEDGIRDRTVTGVQTCALPISGGNGGGSEMAEVRSSSSPRTRW